MERQEVSQGQKTEIQNLALKTSIYANRHAELIEDAFKYGAKVIIEILTMMPRRKREPMETPLQQYKRILERKVKVNHAQDRSEQLSRELEEAREGAKRSKKAGMGASAKELWAMLEVQYKGDQAEIGDILAPSVVEQIRKAPMISKEEYERGLRMLHNLGGK